MTEDPIQGDIRQPAMNDLLTDRQIQQLIKYLAELMGHGWGSLEVEIRHHKAKIIRIKRHELFDNTP